MKEKKEDKKQVKPKVHQSLKGYDIFINEFGEIISTVKTEKLNEFLNLELEDKKLKKKDDK